jgi:hypothetical protein
MTGLTTGRVLVPRMHIEYARRSPKRDSPSRWCATPHVLLVTNCGISPLRRVWHRGCPYHSEVTPAKLRQIDAAEAALKRLGFGVCRVRHYGSIARIEVTRDDIARLLSENVWPEVCAALRSAGFDQVEADTRGFMSGGLNESLPRSS